MKIDPDDGPLVDDFVVVEEGVYPVRIGEVRESRSADGDLSWMLRLELIEGPLAGRTIVTDWLNFTDKGLHRVRRVLDALGYDVTRPIELEAREVEGKTARVEIETRETHVHGGGRLQRRSRVTYDGWRPMDADEPQATGGGGGTAAADSMPF